MYPFGRQQIDSKKVRTSDVVYSYISFFLPSLRNQSVSQVEAGLGGNTNCSSMSRMTCPPPAAQSDIPNSFLWNTSIAASYICCLPYFCHPRWFLLLLLHNTWRGTIAACYWEITCGRNRQYVPSFGIMNIMVRSSRSCCCSSRERSYFLWPLRNVLIWVAFTWGLRNTKIEKWNPWGWDGNLYMLKTAMPIPKTSYS